MPFVLWMTGLPCSGKTTIARKLRELYPKLVMLDGDELRAQSLSNDFSREGINENNRKVDNLAKDFYPCTSTKSKKKKKVSVKDKFIERIEFRIFLIALR